MELRSILPLLRERWRTIVAVALVAVASGALLTVRQTPMYEAHTTLFLSGSAGVGDASKAYQVDLLSQKKVKSYTLIITDRRVMQGVIDRLDLPMTPAGLAARVKAETVDGTVLLTVRVTDPSRQRAQQITGAVADEFIRLVPLLENAPDGEQTAVRISVVSPADLPVAPVSPRPVLNLVLALGAGLLAGVAIATARHSLDTTIKTVEQTEEVAQTAVLGAVPFDQANGRGGVVVAVDEPNGQQAEAYRYVQTSLQFVDVDAEVKVMVVTSCVPEEGKSTTACNLAQSYSEAGRRVLLIDGDLRRPRAAGYLGLPSGVGLTSVLVGKARLEQVIQQWGDNAFAVLACGPIPPNPSKLIGSRHMRRVIEKLRGLYDTIIIDAPPVLPVADALVLGAISDGAVLVVRHGKTHRDHLSKTVAALRRAEVEVLGAVLNMTPRRGPDAYSYYKYTAEPIHAFGSIVDKVSAGLGAIRQKIAVRQ